MSLEVFSGGAFEVAEPHQKRRRNRPYAYQDSLKHPITEADIENVRDLCGDRNESLRHVFAERLDKLAATLEIKASKKDSIKYLIEFVSLLAIRHVPGLRLTDEFVQPKRRGRARSWNDAAHVALLGLIRLKMSRRHLSIESTCKNICKEDCGHLVPVTSQASYAKNYHLAFRRSDLVEAENYYFKRHGVDWFRKMRDGELFTKQPIADAEKRRQAEDHRRRLIRGLGLS